MLPSAAGDKTNEYNISRNAVSLSTKNLETLESSGVFACELSVVVVEKSSSDVNFM
jgi:hypothetical protein